MDVTYASVLLLLVPPSSICCFPLIAGAKSLVTITVVWKFKSKYTLTLTRICCNPLIRKPSMARNVHPSLAHQNNPHKAFLTPSHSLHGQILFSFCVASKTSSSILVFLAHEFHLRFASECWSKFVSSLEIQVQQSNKKMLQSFDIETTHGTQNASFASTSEQPPQSISYTLTFFA